VWWNKIEISVYEQINEYHRRNKWRAGCEAIW
jgi:hypothetical protein